MAVMLPTDDLAIYSSEAVDGHDWADPELEGRLVWSGRGSLQLNPGLVAVDAGAGGGRGPFDPSAAELGRVILPPDAGAADGMVLAARDRRYALSQVYDVRDPAGDWLNCQVATVSEVDRWPA